MGTHDDKDSASAEMRDPSPPTSRLEPVIESDLESLKHLLFDVLDVSELGPTSNITVFRRTLNFYDKIFHQRQLVRVFCSQMLFANVRSLSLTMLGP